MLYMYVYVYMYVTDLLCAAEVERELVPVFIRKHLHIQRRVRDNQLLDLAYPKTEMLVRPLFGWDHRPWSQKLRCWL